jgi:hypothetical protein
VSRILQARRVRGAERKRYAPRGIPPLFVTGSARLCSIAVRLIPFPFPFQPLPERFGCSYMPLDDSRSSVVEVLPDFGRYADRFGGLSVRGLRSARSLATSAAVFWSVQFCIPSRLGSKISTAELIKNLSIPLVSLRIKSFADSLLIESQTIASNSPKANFTDFNR